MEKFKFKTNINCMGCVAQFTEHVQNAEGISHWEVDTTTPDKLLTIEGTLTEKEAVDLVKKAGFTVRESLPLT